MSRSTSLLDDREESYSYRGYDNEDTHRSTSFGPSGEGITGAASTFYQKNRKAVLIALGVTIVVILLIIVIAVAASKEDEGNDPPVVPPVTSSTGTAAPPMGSSTGTLPPESSSSTVPAVTSSTGTGGLSGSSTGGAGPTKTTLGDMTAYQIGSTGPILLYLPDINGVGTAALSLATDYANAGFQVWVLDYFDGGTGRTCGCSIDNSTERTRGAIADIRQRYPSSPVYSTGYCWGGGVGVAVTYGPSRVDLSAVAHAAGVNFTIFNQTIAPILAVMPQYDPSFNGNAGSYMASITCTQCRGHVVELKVYPGVTHGFAVTVNMSDPNAVAQKAAAFADTVAFLKQQVTPSPLIPSLTQQHPIIRSSPQQTGTNITLGGMRTYQTGSGNRILLFLMDINGWKSPMTVLADSYGAQGFSVYMPDYCNGGTCGSVAVDNSTARIRNVISLLRAQYPGTPIFSTGYCYGGGVGLRLASGFPSVDVSVVAHASSVAVPLFANITAPLLAIMPQNDANFNGQVTAYLGTLTCWPINATCVGREAAFKVYPGVGHGFAVTVLLTDPNAVQQKQQAFVDTVNFFNSHSS